MAQQRIVGQLLRWPHRRVTPCAAAPVLSGVILHACMAAENMKSASRVQSHKVQSSVPSECTTAAADAHHFCHGWRLFARCCAADWLGCSSSRSPRRLGGGRPWCRGVWAAAVLGHRDVVQVQVAVSPRLDVCIPWPVVQAIFLQGMWRSLPLMDCPSWRLPGSMILWLCKFSDVCIFKVWWLL